MATFWRNFLLGFFAVVVVWAICFAIGLSWPIALVLGVLAGAAVSVVQHRRHPATT